MKLRRRFTAQQLLSFSVAILLSSEALRAQDRVITKDGKTQDVKIVGVSGGNVQVQIGSGSLAIPMANITQVLMAPPADYADALKAYDEKNYPKALASAKAVADKYKGLPADWAQQAVIMVGDIYAAMNDAAKAEVAYRDYQKLYPGSGTAQTDVGLAKLSVMKKEYAVAKEKLNPLAAAALAEKSPAKALLPVYGQTFLLLGQIEEAQGNQQAALENYLRTAAIFNQDRLAANSAQEKADALRKQNPALAVP